MVAGSHVDKGCSIVSHISSFVCLFISVGNCVNCLSASDVWWVQRLCAPSYTILEELTWLPTGLCFAFLYI